MNNNYEDVLVEGDKFEDECAGPAFGLLFVSKKSGKVEGFVNACVRDVAGGPDFLISILGVGTATSNDVVITSPISKTDAAERFGGKKKADKLAQRGGDILDNAVSTFAKVSAVKQALGPLADLLGPGLLDALLSDEAEVKVGVLGYDPKTGEFQTIAGDDPSDDVKKTVEEAAASGDSGADLTV